MHFIFFLILRRLRTPLLLMITVYSILILGYVLIPGQDSSGQPTRMSFFHAFYFVSFMGSTIGFGEIPNEFTNAQRMWTLLAIYSSVTVWLYSIGSVIATLRDPAFLNLMQRANYQRKINDLSEEYYLVCGYGFTGSYVTRRLSNRGVRCAVIELKAARIEAMEIDGLPIDVPNICADASDPEILQTAGIADAKCIGVICLTDDDHANLAIAITSKLLAPNRLVVSRVESRAYAKNLHSFGTDYILDPFVLFADYLDTAIHFPYRHLIYDWLISPRHREVATAYQQRQGTWIICGYGRLGKAIVKRFDARGLTTVIIDPNPDRIGLKDRHSIAGLGTEANTLLEANIQDAVGIIAGTADDPNNLSIIMTAKELKPELVTVGRRNQRFNQPVFDAAGIDIMMDPSVIISNHIMAILKSHLLIEFLDKIKQQDETWCCQLIHELNAIVGKKELDSWSVTVDPDNTPALCRRMESSPVTIENITTHPQEPEKSLQCRALLLKRGEKTVLLPDAETKIEIGDEFLFCGLTRAASWMHWSTHSISALTYITSGKEETGALWRWLKVRRD